MTNEGYERFSKQWKMPKAEINKIRKEYDSGKSRSDEIRKSIEADKLKCYEDEAEIFFLFFEELAGRKVNRDAMLAHIAYWIDEGFEVDDMKMHGRRSLEADYFKENPARFTVAAILPIKDQDRINRVWDDLAYYQSLRGNMTKIRQSLKQKFIFMHCGHAGQVSDVYCKTCVGLGNEWEVSKNPYAPEVSESMKDFADFYKKRADESGPEYQERVTEKFQTLWKEEKIAYAKRMGAIRTI